MNTYVITQSTTPWEDRRPSHFDPPMWVELTGTILPEGQAISGTYKDGWVMFENGKMNWRVVAKRTRMIPNTVKSHLACDGDKMSMLEVAPEPEGFVDDKEVIRNIIPMTYPYLPDGKFGADGYYSATGSSGKSNPKSSKSNPMNACGEFQPMVYLGADGKGLFGGFFNKKHSSAKQSSPCSTSLGNIPSGGSFDSGSYTCKCNNGKVNCTSKAVQSQTSYIQADGRKGGSTQRQLKPCTSAMGVTPNGGTIESGSYSCTCNDGKFDCKQEAVSFTSNYIQADGGVQDGDHFGSFLNNLNSKQQGVTNNYYSADGKHPFQNFLDSLAPNRAAKGAAKAAEQQSNADLNAAIANQLSQQGSGDASKTANMGGNTMLIVGGAVVGIAILGFVIYKIRNRA